MQALKPVEPILELVEPARKLRRGTMPRRRRNPNQAIAIEITVKLFINIMLAVFATSAVIKLFPYYQSTQEKLEAVEAEVNTAKQQLFEKKDDFSRHFDPRQTQTIMQEQSNLVDPEKVPIIWMESGLNDGLEPR